MLFSLFIWFPFFLGGGVVEYDRHSLLDTESDGVSLRRRFSNYNVVFLAELEFIACRFAMSDDFLYGLIDHVYYFYWMDK